MLTKTPDDIFKCLVFLNQPAKTTNAWIDTSRKNKETQQILTWEKLKPVC